MIILSLDSAGRGCNVCVWQDGRVLALREETMTRGQDARLIPMVQDVMQEVGLDYEVLDRIAVTRGPGSFTGLRIGLASARGIGLATNKPVIGIDRFSIHRAQHPIGDLLVALDSRRAELFTRFYPAEGKAQEPRLLSLEEIIARKAAVMAGDIEGCQPTAQSEAVTVASLAAVAEIGLANYLPRPLYLRAPDVTMPKDCKSEARGKGSL